MPSTPTEQAEMQKLIKEIEDDWNAEGKHLVHDRDKVCHSARHIPVLLSYIRKLESKLKTLEEDETELVQVLKKFAETDTPRGELAKELLALFSLS